MNPSPLIFTDATTAVAVAQQLSDPAIRETFLTALRASLAHRQSTTTQPVETAIDHEKQYKPPLEIL